ncbi:MAG: hypothetical protein ABW092_15985 [Candidatus Thiodiazotropha sp.]
MSSWDDFLNLSEKKQARFLLDVASAAWDQHEKFNDIKIKVESNLKLGYRVLEGDINSLHILIRFLDDPNMIEDFSVFFEQLKDNETAAAALDLASYACGFVCRISAQNAGVNTLPDPVLEALPDVYEYFRDRAGVLGLNTDNVDIK